MEKKKRKESEQKRSQDADRMKDLEKQIASLTTLQYAHNSQIEQLEQRNK